MEIIKADIAIIGGGAAGLRAAIAATEANPKLKIALISKVYPVRSHTVSAEGGIAGVLREYDSFEQHAFDTVLGSDYLADQDKVEFFVAEAPKEIIRLEHWGCPWSREENGKIAVRAFGGMSVKRTAYAADKTGFYMLHSLFERTLKYENIIRFDEWFVTKLLIDENGRALGCVALSMREGKFAAFQAGTTILAAGGAGKTFAFTTNGNIKTGDGMALAYEAGAALKDMEFVQFHPTGLPRTGFLITEAARGEGGYLLNKNGERFMSRYLPEKMELGPRDIISRAITNEIKEGRGIEGPYGAYIFLDIRHLGEKLINERLPLVREISLEFAGIDPVYEPIPVRPVCHYFMGGVSTDISGRTNIKGLYAAGETACVSINGANRLGSNSLAECLVFGAAAGVTAAEENSASTALMQNAIDDEEKRITNIITNTDVIAGSAKAGQSGMPQYLLREEMQRSMQKYAGIERDAKGLQEGLNKILELKERAKNISLSDTSLIFNTELTSLLELKNMLTVSEAVLRAASARAESRGSHLRTDAPNRNDKEFLHHLLIKKTGSGMIMDTSPVSITKWQPQLRKY